MNDDYAGELSFDGPATYRICVRGKLPAKWSDRLEGMSIRVVAPDDGPPVTTLVGELLDQASLSGVLNTLYELHLAVLSVVCISGTEGLDRESRAASSRFR